MKDLLVRDQPSSFHDLVTLALRMDERLRERRLERAQRPVNSARTPGTRLARPDVARSNPMPPKDPIPCRLPHRLAPF